MDAEYISLEHKIPTTPQYTIPVPGNRKVTPWEELNQNDMNELTELRPESQWLPVN